MNITSQLLLTFAILAAGLTGCQATAAPPPGQKDPRPRPTPTPTPTTPGPARSPAASAAPKNSICSALENKQYLRTWTEKSADNGLSGRRRVALARRNKLAVVQKLFSDAGVKWPPKQLLLRAFKKQKVLEVWASASTRGALTRIANYGICQMSGSLGPKRREGDGQVPEGFYTLDYYKNNSDFFMAMRVSYPNRRDRKLRHTGSAIMIHGNCVSIGCLAMSDERIQELWLLTSAARRHNKVAVHIFPSCGMTRAIKGAAKHPKLQTFWTNIKQGMDLFEKDRTLRRWRVGPGGEYLFP